MTTPSLPPVKIAFVIDGVVADVLHTDDRLAAIFLSQPTIVDVSEFVLENPDVQLVNATYDGTTFTPASDISVQDADAQAIADAIDAAAAEETPAE